jgi:crotonobetainyl-CoA:carnitine CoA-transferase CaiB-like acyl-CoA transferase
MLDGELQAVAPALMDASMNGRVQSRIGNRHAWLAPQGVYRSKGDDSWVAISVATEEQWRALCSVIERPDLASDPAFATHEGRHARHDELDRAIEAWTSRREHHETQAALQAAGVPAGAVLDVPEAFEDPQLVHRGSFTWVEHPHVGAFPHIRTAWRSRRGNDGVTGTAPLFGEATDYVLRDLLGMSDSEVEALEESGTVTHAPVR